MNLQNWDWIWGSCAVWVFVFSARPASCALGTLQVKEDEKADRGWVVKGVPVAMKAMVLAGDKLFVAGPPDAVDPKGGILLAFSANDGKKLCEIKLDTPPVFDGMAAADGRLYLSTQDGKLLCFGKKGD